MENPNNKRNKVTDELVLSMIIDIKQSIDEKKFSHKELIEKYKGTVNSIIAILKRKEYTVKVGTEIIWVADYPNLSMAMEIRKEYIQSMKLSHKKYLENKEKMAQHKKHLESIQKTEEMLEKKQKEEELISDPLNFEVPLDKHKVLDENSENPYLMPIEDFQRLQIDSYIRQTTILQSEIEELKSKIKRKDETISSMHQTHNDLLEEASDYVNKIRDLEFQLKANKQKRVIRLFGIKIGSIG